jgi:hypothetical protein
VDGNRLRINWGPDCPVDSNGPLVIAVNSCRAIPQPGGGVVLDLSTSSRPVTSTTFGSGMGRGWVILPDGSLVDTNGD